MLGTWRGEEDLAIDLLSYLWKTSNTETRIKFGVILPLSKELFLYLVI